MVGLSAAARVLRTCGVLQLAASREQNGLKGKEGSRATNYSGFVPSELVQGPKGPCWHGRCRHVSKQEICFEGTIDRILVGYGTGRKWMQQG